MLRAMGANSLFNMASQDGEHWVGGQPIITWSKNQAWRKHRMRTYLSDLASRLTAVTHEPSSLEPMFLLAWRGRGQTDNALLEDTYRIFGGGELLSAKTLEPPSEIRLMKASYLCRRSWNLCEKGSSLLQVAP